ncbi:MAG: FRG domain-containing protein [Reyranella sp.]
MAIVERVKDVSEAIQLAAHGRTSGRWQLFRGQSNAAWTVTSSFERLDGREKRQADAQMKRFAGWASSENSMQEYWKEPDALWAIAQHYGIKTQFIDFTDDPSVAAFFACDGNAKDGQQAAIICLDTDDFTRFWENAWPFAAKKHPNVKPPEFIRIDVANLWRLQTQQGSFLWNPAHGIEHWYDFDRIVFPCTKDALGLPSRSTIYPVNQSALEQKLTRFFMNERMREGARILETFKPQARIRIKSSNRNYDAKYWWPPGIALAENWNVSSQWLLQKTEHANDVLPGATFNLPDTAEPEMLCRTLQKQLNSQFVKKHRHSSLYFPDRLQATDSPHYARISAVTRSIWDGMRILPYTSVEIGKTLQRAFILLPLALKNEHGRPVLGADSLYVEMASGTKGGAYSRGAITKAGMYAALSRTFVNASEKHTEQSIHDLAEKVLLLPARPWQRFSFAGLRKLFVEEIIPTQVVWRIRGNESHSLNTTIYFSPLELKIFGLA